MQSPCLCGSSQRDASAAYESHEIGEIRQRVRAPRAPLGAYSDAVAERCFGLRTQQFPAAGNPPCVSTESLPLFELIANIFQWVGSTIPPCKGLLQCQPSCSALFQEREPRRSRRSITTCPSTLHARGAGMRASCVCATTSCARRRATLARADLFHLDRYWLALTRRGFWNVDAQHTILALSRDLAGIDIFWKRKAA